MYKTYVIIGCNNSIERTQTKLSLMVAQLGPQHVGEKVTIHTLLYVHFVGVLKDIIYDKIHRMKSCKMTF